MKIKATIDIPCSDCADSNNKPHKAFGLCVTCYNKDYKRKQRAEQKVSTGVN